ncbi:DNA damage-inducible protein YebG, partial [Salmonella enterica subsp. enterica serovar Enteritidis str. 6.0562-1]
MAVEVKYVVIREGEEKMSFTSKKEADAWDKMLDTADLLDTWLEQSPVVLEDGQREALSLWLAEHKEVLSTILKTGNDRQGLFFRNIQERAIVANTGFNIKTRAFYTVKITGNQGNSPHAIRYAS